MPSNSAACAWCEGMPQNREPGSAMLAHRRPFERTARQRCIVDSSSGSHSSSSSSYATAWLSGFMRSEEHTSELQSRQYLVCRLLLEKKKKPTAQVQCRQSYDN